MQKFPVIVLNVLVLAACTSSNTSREQSVPMHQSGYILQVDGITGWNLKQNDSGQFIHLTFDGLTSCVKETTGASCTVTDLVEGMQLDIRGSGEPIVNTGYASMEVTDIRVIGTSRTIKRTGRYSGTNYGRLLVTDDETGTKTQVSYGTATECTIHDGEEVHVPCTPARLDGRGGTIVGEVREGETILRATWIDAP